MLYTLSYIDTYTMELVLLRLEEGLTTCGLADMLQFGVHCWAHILAVVRQEVVGGPRVLGGLHLEGLSMVVILVETWVLLYMNEIE
jgi:hypothetical protein